MTTFTAEFLGCKVALADSQAVHERLAADGHRERSDGRIRVVTTCCVTAEAVAKSRKAVRRAARSADRVFVTGCAANLEGAGFEGLAENVTVVRGPADAVPALVAGTLGGLGCVGGDAPRFARTRAYVKVQDGCSFGCSFCVIPQVRGPSRSRSAAAVLDEVRRRAQQGHPEVVLTGINLGCFRDREAGMRLEDVMLAAAEVDGIGRVRLSSIEVNHLTDRLIDALAHPGVASHLHVPLQSGDDGVLRAMRRRYAAQGFLRAVERARARVPGLNVTSDVIVGHPAEDEAAFGRTLDTVRAAALGAVHVFPYSPRPDTRDAGSDPVPPAVKRSRSRRLRALSDELGLARRRGAVGRPARVLVETESGRGFADDYVPFVVAGADPARFAEVVATGLGDGVVIGQAA
ncbi:MAG: MiaB/RimO family radical SAM methylthiotransferase [Gaiellales bacterium]